MRLTLADLAARLAGEVAGDAATEVTGVAGYATVAPGELTFVDDRDAAGRPLDAATLQKRLHEALASAAAAVIVPRSIPTAAKPLLRVTHPKLAFAQALAIFHPTPPPPPGVHPSAVVMPDTQVDASASVGPLAVITPGARIGARTLIGAGCYIGMGVQIGDDCRVYARVVLQRGVTLGDRVTVHSGTVIGSDGFGYVQDEGRHHKIPQVGGVRIEDDVEIGANTTIDRGTTGDTVIGAGTKIDNLVQIAHNVVVGRNCIIVAQTGVAGSAVLEDGCILAAQVGVHDHARIGAGAIVLGRSGVVADVPAGTVVSGFPARPHREELQLEALRRTLPEMRDNLRALAARLERLDKSGE